MILEEEGFFIDKDGNWYYLGTEATREEIIELFIKNLVKLGNNIFAIKWEDKYYRIEVEDVPLVVSSIEIEIEDNKIKEILLKLKYVKAPIKLNPEKLFIGKNNALYTIIEPQEIPAKFSRSAHFHMANMFNEDEAGKYYIEIDGKRYYPLTVPQI